MRSHLAELGLVADRGKPNLRTLLQVACDKSELGIPDAARFALQEIVEQIQVLQKRIDKLDHEILVRARRDEDSKRLMTIPGVGPMVAEAVRTLAPDPSEFKSSRHFAAWIGLTPKSHSSGGNEVLGHISKMGNRHLRSLLVVGAMAVLRHSKANNERNSWLLRLKQRRPFKVVAVALANKTARIIWALLMNGGIYNRPGSARYEAAYT